jgi:PhoH-like ATPase
VAHGPGKRTYILDTNVLLHDPNAIHHFEDNVVVIPLKVLEEIDNFKRDQSELGRNARQVSRMLDAHRQNGKLSDGVKMPGGGVVKVAFPGDRDHLPVSGSKKYVYSCGAKMKAFKFGSYPVDL